MVRVHLGPLKLWPVGQAVKTPPFHGGNTGSSPVRVILRRSWTSLFFMSKMIFHKFSDLLMVLLVTAAIFLL